MAEHVQAAMDQMVSPLKDLMDRNVFTAQEVQHIVKRRRESEYLLRRPTARKADFLRYIEAEQALEKLRKLRTNQLKRNQKEQQQQQHVEEEEEDGDEQDNNEEKKKSSTKHIGDVHIVQHIHLLFVRAIRKFRSDMSLHLLHADFAKEQRSFKRLGRIYAEALQIFPRQVGLWIEAASQEYFGDGTGSNQGRSIRSARVLFQRAVRINATSEDLWMEYFTLELHYAQTLKGRKQILQGDDNSNKEEDDYELYYKIAAIVLKNALQKTSDSIPFRLRVLDTCKRFPNTQKFMEMIQSSLQADFSHTPEAWIARAMYAAEQGTASTTTSIEARAKEEEDDGSEEEEEQESRDSEDEEQPSSKNKRARISDPVVSVLEEAIETLSTGEMYVQAFRFARSYFGELQSRSNESDDDDDRDHNTALYEVQKFIQAMTQVPAHKHSSPDLALEQADYFESLGQAEDAIRLLKDYCTTSKAPASLWIHWADLVVGNKKKRSILQRGLDRTPMNDPGHRPLLLQLFAVQLEENEANEDDNESTNAATTALMETFQRLLLLAPGKEVIMAKDEEENDDTGVFESTAHASLKYLQHGYTTGGLVLARRIYSLVLFQTSSDDLFSDGSVECMKDFLDDCLKMETEKKRLRRIFDRAIEIFQGTPLEGHYRTQKNDKVCYPQ